MRYIAIIFAALAFAAPASALDTSMLQQWTPTTPAQLAATDSVALSYLAKGWLIAGNPQEARTLTDELDRRGVLAFTAGNLHSLVNNSWNPADTEYAVTIVQVLDAMRWVGDDTGVQLALGELKKLPMVDSDGCWAYSTPDAPVGCIQDIGGISLAVLSGVPSWDYGAQLAYESGTIEPSGSWIEFQDSPIGQGQVEDAAHLAWTAYMLLNSPDPAVRALGDRAAHYVAENYDPATAPPYSIYAVAAAEIEDGLGGCDLAAQLPSWANSYRQVDADGSVSVKNQEWAAYVYTWSQMYCDPSSR